MCRVHGCWIVTQPMIDLLFGHPPTTHSLENLFLRRRHDENHDGIGNDTFEQECTPGYQVNNNILSCFQSSTKSFDWQTIMMTSDNYMIEKITAMPQRYKCFFKIGRAHV